MVSKDFSIVLPDQALRMSELWQRRTDIEWSETFKDLESKQLGYFDQLAVSRASLANIRTHTGNHNRLGLFVSQTRLFTRYHRPQTSSKLGGCSVSSVLGSHSSRKIDEVDSNVGQLLSEVWLAKQESLRHFIEHPPSQRSLPI